MEFVNDVFTGTEYVITTEARKLADEHANS